MPKTSEAKPKALTAADVTGVGTGPFFKPTIEAAYAAALSLYDQLNSAGLELHDGYSIKESSKLKPNVVNIHLTVTVSSKLTHPKRSKAK